MPEKIEFVHVRKENGAGFEDVENEDRDEVHLDVPPSSVQTVREIRKALRSRKSVTTRDPPTRRSRSAHMQLTHAESTHDEPPNADLIDPESQYAIPTNLLVLGLLHILLGIISLTICMVLYFSHSVIEVYLEAAHSHTHSPSFFAFISEILTIIAGFGLTGCLLFNVNSFYRVYPHLLWMIVMFDLVTIMFSFGSWRQLNMSAYARMFESESMIFCEDNYEYYNILWDRPPNSRDPEPRLWGKLESSLRCCGRGLHEDEDWPKVCNGKVPLTCCRDSSLQACHRKLKIWNAAAGNSTPAIFSSIKPMLYQKSCLHVLSLEANSIQRDWVIFPLIIALFDLILMINGNHKAREIRFKLESARGRRELTQFRVHCWNKLRCTSTKVGPSDDLSGGTGSFDSPTCSLTHECGFVTDRKSLHGLAVVGSSKGNLANDATLSLAEVKPIINKLPFKKEN